MSGIPKNKGKGKAKSHTTNQDPEWTEWSNWEWHQDGYWESFRTNSNGEEEWKSEYPADTSVPEPNIPRSEAHKYYDRFAPNPEPGPPEPESSAGWNYQTSGSVQVSPSYENRAGSVTPVGNSNPYYANSQSPATGSSSNPWPVITSPAWETTQGKTASQFQQLSDMTQRFHGFGINSQPAGFLAMQGNLHQGQASQDPARLPQEPKRIKREYNSPDKEKLDPRYHVIPDKDSPSFWKFGRVFMMLWSEPAGEKIATEGGTRNGSHISTTHYLKGPVFSEIRRFVVVQDRRGSCSCLAIHTYSNHATLKYNLPNPDEHAIIYTDQCPDLHYENGQWEELSRDPIKVDSESKEKEGKLHPLSRIDYGKVYTVEKNVRVLKIGMVSKHSINSLKTNSPLKSSESTFRPKNHRSGSSSHHKR